MGMPEAILCQGKDDASLAAVIEELSAQPEHPLLLTRLDEIQVDALPAELREALDYDAYSRTAILTEDLPGRAACHYCGPCPRGCSTGSYFSTQSSTLPAARATGNLTLLADKLVELELVDSISPATVGTLLKKTNSSPGKTGNGVSGRSAACSSC